MCLYLIYVLLPHIVDIHNYTDIYLIFMAPLWTVYDTEGTKKLPEEFFCSKLYDYGQAVPEAAIAVV